MRGRAVLWVVGVSRESCGGSGLALPRPAPPPGAWAGGAEQSRLLLSAAVAPKWVCFQKMQCTRCAWNRISHGIRTM
ncbi:hypothetical protein GRJ2_001887800 [Grus japonensis]|uniref:Secreted protein n=1 Tax=Grus japonensis TaxID=30415 RepID=A0ABC9X9B9_GRUJA